MSESGDELRGYGEGRVGERGPGEGSGAVNCAIFCPRFSLRLRFIGRGPILERVRMFCCPYLTKPCFRHTSATHCSISSCVSMLIVDIGVDIPGPAVEHVGNEAVLDQEAAYFGVIISCS